MLPIAYVSKRRRRDSTPHNAVIGKLLECLWWWTCSPKLCVCTVEGEHVLLLTCSAESAGRLLRRVAEWLECLWRWTCSPELCVCTVEGEHVLLLTCSAVSRKVATLSVCHSLLRQVAELQECWITIWKCLEETGSSLIEVLISGVPGVPKTYLSPDSSCPRLGANWVPKGYIHGELKLHVLVRRAVPTKNFKRCLFYLHVIAAACSGTWWWPTRTETCSGSKI
jgi:hypothetical protein